MPSAYAGDVIIDEFEYDEIENEYVGALLGIVDKNKAPVLYRALMYAKESGDRVQLCFNSRHKRIRETALSYRKENEKWKMLKNIA